MTLNGYTWQKLLNFHSVKSGEFQFGGYVGEVIIRHMGVEAIWEEEKLSDGSRVLLRFSNQGQASPPEKVYKRLTQSPHDGVSGYYRGLKHVIMQELNQ
jgi:hypothetical protein